MYGLIRLVFVSMVSTGLLACSLLQRSPQSGYQNQNDAALDSAQQFYQDRGAFEVAKTKEELGISPTQPLSEKNALMLSQRLQLKRMEERLESSRERKQYYHYKPMMLTDAERIRFLSYPSLEARERFANQAGLVTKFETFGDHVDKAIEENDIALGMTKKAVLESWGDPDLVEVAGNPLFGNERWKYNKMVGGDNGYNKEQRIIYFESGRVAGWESF